MPDQPTPFEKAVGLHSAKDWSSAEGALGEIIRSDPSNGLPWHFLGITLARRFSQQKTYGGKTWTIKHDLTYIRKK